MKNSPHRDEYTVVLGSRARRDGYARLNVKKEERSVYTRGSPRDHPPPHDLRRYRGGTIEHEVPLGVFDVFGAGMARMAARALVLLLVCQPVYVAFGMELDGTVEASVEGITVVEGEAPRAEEIEGAEGELGAETHTPDASSPEQTTGTGADETVDDEVEGDELPRVEEHVADGDVEEGVAREVTEDESTSPTADGENGGATGASSAPANEEGETEDGAEEGETSEDHASTLESEGGSSETTADDGTGEGTDTSETAGEGSDSSSENGASEGDANGVGGTGEESGTSEGEAGDVSLPATTASSSATSTIDVEEELTESVLPTEQHTGNKYVFGESDCTVVSDGEFYCTKRSGQAVRAGRTHVYAQLDREGDREIYLARGGGVEQVTDNMIDDFAPVFDEETGRVAWHASLEDRLQILFRDPVRGMVQVTRGDENNSNPSLSGDKLVWQGWRGNDWEVFLAQHLNGDIVVEQLTQNNVHDMFPQVRGNLVSWQEEREGGAVVIVYDIDKGERTLLNKDSAGKYENPRFMLVFESKDENGDVATIGYDVVTGEEVELGTNPNKNTVPVPQTPADHTGDAVPVEAATGTSSVKTVRNERE